MDWGNAVNGSSFCKFHTLLVSPLLSKINICVATAWQWSSIRQQSDPLCLFEDL